MSLITIEASLPNLDNVIRAVDRATGSGKGLPYTREALHDALNIIQRTWVSYASGTEVQYSGGTFKINVVSGNYLRSLQHAPRFLGDLSGEVFSDSPYGRMIEEGYPAFDMKPGLLASPKAKVSKQGKRYITVAFRHGTPGTKTMRAMPRSIYQEAKKLTYSRRIDGLTDQQRIYQWGGRYMENKPAEQQTGWRISHTGYAWKAGLYQGMVRMGQPRHTQYLTFRRISENSADNSWIHPGVKPRPIRQAVVENTREEVLQLIRRGFEVDLYFMGLGGG